MSHDAPTPQQIDSFLKSQPAWDLADNKLLAEFKFADFKAAFNFMAKVADVAEAINHHPNWSNAYNRVNFELWTHETGGVSHHDLELATAISRLATK